MKRSEFITQYVQRERERTPACSAMLSMCIHTYIHSYMQHRAIYWVCIYIYMHIHTSI